MNWPQIGYIKLRFVEWNAIQTREIIHSKKYFSHIYTFQTLPITKKSETREHNTLTCFILRNSVNSLNNEFQHKLNQIVDLSNG